MATYTRTYVVCDICGEVWDDAESQGVREARRNTPRGWAYDRTRGDTCPLHNGYYRIDGPYYKETEA